jgi:hypothetical protein
MHAEPRKPFNTPGYHRRDRRWRWLRWGLAFLVLAVVVFVLALVTGTLTI